MEALSKKIDSLALPKLVAIMACETCGGGHMVINWPIIGAMHGPSE